MEVDDVRAPRPIEAAEFEYSSEVHGRPDLTDQGIDLDLPDAVGRPTHAEPPPSGPEATMTSSPRSDNPTERSVTTACDPPNSERVMTWRIFIDHCPSTTRAHTYGGVRSHTDTAPTLVQRRRRGAPARQSAPGFGRPETEAPGVESCEGAS